MHALRTPSRWLLATSLLLGLVLGPAPGHAGTVGKITGVVQDPDGRPIPDLFAPDQLHFSAEGYRLLADRVRPFLAK